jgi:WD40 repeat protein
LSIFLHGIFMIKLRLLPAPLARKGQDVELAACAYSRDDRQILSGGWDGMLRVWDAESGEETAAIAASTKPVIASATSPDGKYFLSACLNGFLAHWEAATLEKAAYFLAHWRPISGIAFDRPGRLMATSSWDSNLILWDLDPSRNWRSLSGHEDIVAGCMFTPDDAQLLSWSHDATLRLWDVQTAEFAARFQGHSDRVTTAAISHDGRWVLSGSRDQTLRLWERQTATEITCCTMASPVCGCFFLPDDRTVLAVNEDGSISVHHLPDLDQQAELLTELRVQQVALSHEGGQLALACGDGILRRIALEGLVRADRSAADELKKRPESRRQMVGKRIRQLLQFTRGIPLEKNV